MKSLIRKLRNLTRFSKARREVKLFALIGIAHAKEPARACQEAPDR